MADNPEPIQVTITAQIQGLMDGLNEATAGVKDATDQMADSFSGMKPVSTETFAGITAESHAAAESMEADFSKTEARHAAHMLGMNRAVGGFVATLPGVGQALSMAFAPLAIMEMIEWISKGIEKLVSLHEASAESAHKVEEAIDGAAQAGTMKLSELGDKLLEAQEKTDELAGNHIGTLRDQLELLDHASLRNLIASLQQVTEQADKTFEVLFTNAKAWYDVLGQNTALIAGAKSAWDAYAEGQRKMYDDLQAAETKLQATSDPEKRKAVEEEIASIKQTAAKNTVDTIGAANRNLEAQQFLLQHANDTYLQRQEISKQLADAEATIGDKSAIIDQNSIQAQQQLIQQLNRRKDVVQAIANIEAQQASNAKTEEGKKSAAATQSVSEARLKGIEQANGAELQAEDKAAEETLKLQDATIKQQVALAVEGGTLKAQAELDALPKYIAAQQAFTQAKLSALDKDHAAQLKANADERALLEAGNSGGQNNAKLIENANQKAALEQKYQTERASIIAAGKTAVVQLETEEANQRTEIAKEAAKQRQDVERANAAEKRTLALEAADAEIQADRNLQSSGQITKAQLLEDEKNYLREKLAIDEQADAEDLALLTKGTAAYIKEQDKILDAARKEKAAEAALDDKAAAEKLASYQHVAKGIANSFASTTADLIKGTESWSKAFTSAMNTALDSSVKMLYESLAKHIATEYAKTSATTAGTASRLAVSTAAGAKDMARSIAEGVRHLFTETHKTAATVAGTATRETADTAATARGTAANATEVATHTAMETTKTTVTLAAIAARLAAQVTANVAEITGSAADYAVNAMASVAAIPVTGWAMAPGVGAAAYATGMSFLPSAAGGWDSVPADTLAHIHKQEMVMSAPLATGLRNLIANGGENGGGTTVNAHFHGCFDSKTFFQQNQGQMVAAIQDAVKNRRS